MVDYLADLAGRYPIASIEDGLFRGRLGRLARMLTAAARRQACRLVGDDLFVTNPDRRLARGIEEGCANAHPR